MAAAQTRGLIHGPRVAALEQCVGRSAHDEEGRLQLKAVRPLEVDVAAIHHIERAGFDGDLVEDVDVVYLAVGDADKGWDRAAQVQQRVQFDSRFVGAEPGPWKQCEGKIDRDRV